MNGFNRRGITTGIAFRADGSGGDLNVVTPRLAIAADVVGIVFVVFVIFVVRDVVRIVGVVWVEVVFNVVWRSIIIGTSPKQAHHHNHQHTKCAPNRTSVYHRSSSADVIEKYSTGRVLKSTFNCNVVLSSPNKRITQVTKELIKRSHIMFCDCLHLNSPQWQPVRCWHGAL